MDFVWFLMAVITIGGEVSEHRLDSFERPGDCAKAIELTVPVADVTYECIGENPHSRWISQPSWMSNEMADKLRRK